MKKLACLAVLLPLIYLLAGLNSNSLTNTSGPPAGYTGSPFDAKTCGTGGGCHFINFKVKPGWITSNVPGTGYIPGFTYTITAKVINPIRNKFGFECSPQSSAGTQLGTLIVTNATETKLASSKYITHTAAGCGGSGSRTWTFNWKAPISGTGNVTFYGAFNASNANGSSSGDSIYTSNLLITEDPNVSIADLNAAGMRISLFPNPSSGKFSIRTPFNDNGSFVVRIVDAAGRIVSEENSTLSFMEADLSSLPKGVYYVVMEHGTDIVMEKIVLF